MLVVTAGGAVRVIPVAPSFVSKLNPTAHTNVQYRYLTSYSVFIPPQLERK